MDEREKLKKLISRFHWKTTWEKLRPKFDLINNSVVEINKFIDDPKTSQETIRNLLFFFSCLEEALTVADEFHSRSLMDPDIH